MSTDQPPNAYPRRQVRLAQAMHSAGFDAFAANAGPTLTYLTGLHFHLSERPVIGIFTAHNPPILFLPELEALKTQSLSFELESNTYGEDPETWMQGLASALKKLKRETTRIAIEPRRLRVLELRLLEAALPAAELISAEELVASLRMRKDNQEVNALRQAVRVAQTALRAFVPLIQPGKTERQLASELTAQLLECGADPELPFSPILASGPNSANPHAVPSHRPLQPGDLLIVDWGAFVDGYCSDLTRTFSMGEPSPELAGIAQVVAEANAAARELAAPGIPAGELDRAARQVIEQSGYGPYFTHRTGHGLGMESHEGPYIRQGNPGLLEPGMTFTIEPGIYLPGQAGVRIEDNIVITDSGAESLSDLPRELHTL